MQSTTQTLHKPSLRGWFKIYRELSKSGIVALVIISVLSGFFLGHPFEKPLDWSTFAWTLFGILFLASGSSAWNQIQERHIDIKMDRTLGRPLPSQRISTLHAILSASIAIAIGLLSLFHVSFELLALGSLAVLSYNGLYTLWWKKHWSYAAIPGALPGALPVLMGHLAASSSGSDTKFATFSQIEPGAWYLFAVLFYWQMPHFWSLALRYSEDYRKGGIPTLPTSRGKTVTVFQIVIWTLAYVALSLIAPFFLGVHTLYLGITVAMGAKLLIELKHFAKNPDGKSWLRFFLWINLSLIVYLAAALIDLWSVYLIPYIWA